MFLGCPLAEQPTTVVCDFRPPPSKILLGDRIGMKFGTKVEGILKFEALYDSADFDHVIISIIAKISIFWPFFRVGGS